MASESFYKELQKNSTEQIRLFRNIKDIESFTTWVTSLEHLNDKEEMLTKIRETNSMVSTLRFFGGAKENAEHVSEYIKSSQTLLQEMQTIAQREKDKIENRLEEWRRSYQQE